MMNQAHSKRRGNYGLLPIATAALTAVIFIVDTLTGVNLPVGVFYVAVVLMTVRFRRARGVVLVAAGCSGLTVLSYFVSHPAAPPALDVINLLIGIGAIGVTSLLALQSQSAKDTVHEQASLLDLTHDTIFVRDVHDRITYWNRGAEDLYGWARDDVLGKVSHQLTQTIFPVPVGVINADLLRSGRWEGELVHTKHDGTQVVVASRWALQRNEQGNPIAILETNNDVTERKRAEQALRNSEEKWRAVFENNPTMYFMVDAAGTILSVNAHGAEQLGYPVDELTGDPVAKVLHEADRAAAQRNIISCLDQLGQTMTWELRKVRKDGSMVWVRETARAMLMEGRPVILIACEDISERKRGQYLTAQVFESSPDGIAIVGRDYRYRRVNPDYERVWGMPVERFVGKHVADLVGAEFFEQTTKPHLDRCFGGEAVNYAEWITNSLGRRYMAIAYTPLRPGSERVEAALVITRDLTDLILASEALRTSQAELAHVNRVATMGQLTASIAHEVNQPIAAAVTNAQVALRWLDARPPNLDEMRQALGEIVKSGNRAADVIGRIRALIKKAPARKARFDLNEAVRDVIALTRSEMVRHGVTLQTELATGLTPVAGDRVQLQQVILNLVMNGIEAMKDVADLPRELLIRSKPHEAGAMLVAVQDSGVGLDPQNLKRVFEAFYTTKPEGMGMGLAICRSIIEAHGGRLWATANEPRGAVFQFSLPPERDETVTAEHAGQT